MKTGKFIGHSAKMLPFILLDIIALYRVQFIARVQYRALNVFEFDEISFALFEVRGKQSSE